ncbi:hypothetical protein G6O69_16690 [Pseudenhygromyxa sp. WMMC2535]|uniref:hypothetical protein n=1 Tax=Pseudenhygromyxa sp. WMMC2535 TaxID=2712867 RepID=UPI0015550F1A|nr:hypothetical protein [Pseudenhygromyxa sp. WMMC2535]NVB39482.1 hypothetical protein [Pseudenhygromyxa sp. WMMC2535]
MLTSTLAPAFLSLFVSGPFASEPVAEPMATPEGALTITHAAVEVTDIGDGQFSSSLTAVGSISNGLAPAPTALALDCLVDNAVQVLDCSGSISGPGGEMPIGMTWVEGVAHYSTSAAALDASINGLLFTNWYNEFLVNVIPQDDDDDDDDDCGYCGGGAPRGGVIVLEDVIVTGDVGNVIFMQDDWLIIVDGVVMNPELID